MTTPKADTERGAWKLVPVEPTEKMYAAANREWDGRMSARSCGVWQAMISAAPSEVPSHGTTGIASFPAASPAVHSGGARKAVVKELADFLHDYVSRGHKNTVADVAEGCLSIITRHRHPPTQNTTRE